MLLHFGPVPILVVSSADAAHELFKTHDLKVSNRPKTKAVDKLLNGGTDVAFSPYGDYWKQIKSILVLNLLSNKTVRSFENIREEEITVKMEKLKKASSMSLSVNLSELLHTLTNNVINRIVLERKYNSEEGGNISKNIVRRFMEVLGAFPVGEYIHCLAFIDRIRGMDGKMEQVNNEIDSFLERMVQEHLHSDEARSDFIDILLSIQRDKTTTFELDRSFLKILLLDVLFGGSSTVFALLEWAMTELMRHPECMKKLQEEIRSVCMDTLYVTEKEAKMMNYLNMVIKEVLRLHPPGPLIPRMFSEDVQLNGYDIAAGTHVLINIWAIQRDTTVWGPDAEEFRPERHLDSLVDFHEPNLKYIPFGTGRRSCPGSGFALVLVQVTLANLVNWFDWKVEVGSHGDDKPDLHEAIGLDVCREFPLIVRPSSISFTSRTNAFLEN